MAKPKEMWKDPSFLTEVITGTVLALWIFVTELAKLDVYFSVVVGIILYIVFLVSLVYRNYASDRLQLETLKMQLDAERGKVFTEKVQAASILRSEELRIGWDSINRAVNILEETLKEETEQTMSESRRNTYEEIIRRLKDFARGYSPYGAY